ncbi:LPS export ABC transporter periplasmic protein LptC [Pedobacter sp.]|uniref:LPS export ABC transporter periplasmic protein LptC n=1 Tax=Pedobacter sp. TaxID=1411316 RepID=UPI003D7FEF0D
MPLFLSACSEDDLKKAAAISASKVTFTRDRSLGVEVIYSDSAKVKAKGFAPVLDKMSPKDGNTYQEMPKGVAIDFYGDLLVKTGSIKSDYAIMKDTEQLTIFRKNVVVVTDNMTFTTDELTWDQKEKKFFSPKGVVTRPDGSFVDAINFSAPQDFSTTTFEQGFGETYIKGDLSQQ